MRGKGDDLCDGSEVKGANFIDSLDKNGATAPRWNFNSVSVDIMERFLDYKAIFLLSIDLNPKHQISHQNLESRYPQTYSVAQSL